MNETVASADKMVLHDLHVRSRTLLTPKSIVKVEYVTTCIEDPLLLITILFCVLFLLSKIGVFTVRYACGCV